VVFAAAVVQRAVDQQPWLHDYFSGIGNPQSIDAGGSDTVRTGDNHARLPRQSQTGNSPGKAANNQSQSASGELELACYPQRRRAPSKLS
jgi:hypothetical protein